MILINLNKILIINCLDVVDGNMKSLMRLILAIAAHFKPSSVGSSKSVSAVAVDAAAVMGNLRRQVSQSGRSRHRFVIWFYK